MFLREATVRITGDRLAGFWMLFEPVAIIVIMIGIRSVALSRGSINGVEHIPWLMVGLLGFFLFRENMLRAMGAIDFNRGLFAYRQVHPVDPVIVRFFVEGALKTFVFLMFISFSLLTDIDLVPDQPLYALFIWFSLWMLGAGVGLVVSALATLVNEVGLITRILSFPLLLISGAFFPLTQIPEQFRQLLMINPIAHGLELLRSAFFDEYWAMPEASLLYLWLWILAWTLLGLVLHIRFRMRLVAA